MRNFFNTLRRYKVSSVLNIAGLSIAFAAIYFLIAQVRYDVTFNDAIEDNQNIYEVFVPTWDDSTRVMPFVPRVLMEEVAKCTPLIEEIVPVPAYSFTQRFVWINSSDNASFDLKYAMGFASSGTFELLGYNIIEGSLQNFDSERFYFQAAISRSAAEKSGLKVGDLIATIENKKAGITVAAIFEDRVANTTFSGVEIFTNIGKDNDPTLNRWNNAYFVKAAKGVTKEELNTTASDQIDAALESRFTDYFADGNQGQLRTSYLPLSKLYFSENIDHYTPDDYGDKTYTVMLIAVALIIIVIALLNFVNFFFALMPVRIRTINLCKIFGSQNSTLRMNFIFETFSLILLSLVISLALIYVMVDFNIGKYFTSPVALGENWAVVGIIAVCALVVSVLASLYPSYRITSFPATLSIKGNFGATKQGKTLRYGLLALQLIVSITLISVVAFFNLQLSFVKSKDLGFNTENLIMIKNGQTLSKKTANENLCTQILSISGVESMTSSSYPVVQEEFGQNGQLINGIEGYVNVIYVAPNFFDFMDMEIINGRKLFASDEPYNDELEVDRTKAVFNEAAAKTFNVTLKNDILGRGAFEVIGICKDINNFSLDKEIRPLAYAGMRGEIGWNRFNYIRYKEGADVEAIITEVRNLICKLDPNESIGTISINTFEDHIEEVYSTQSDLVNKIALFTLISIVISLMGIFGLVYFDIQYKRREIAIRRVLGASVTSILKTINKTYLKITVVCFIVAAPLSYYIASSYLSTFAYRTPIHWWVFALVFIFIAVLVASIITISSYRTANTNPREAVNKNN
ncbi:MAG: FtsX-like permease family protein [Rikenellaceae bacterium]